MPFSSLDIQWFFESEIRRKLSMSYRKSRVPFPMDGFWRPGPDDVAPAIVSLENIIEEDVAAHHSMVRAA